MRRVPVDEGMSADKLGKCFFIFWKIPRIRPMEIKAKIFFQENHQLIEHRISELHTRLLQEVKQWL